MLNSKQWAALRVGAVVAVVMALFPPFFARVGPNGGVRFAFVLQAAAPKIEINSGPRLAGGVLLLQLSAVACFTLMAALARDERANQRCRRACNACALSAFGFVVGFAAFSLSEPGRGLTSPPFLLCVIPVEFPGGYFLFWLRLAWLAFVGLQAASLANCGIKTAVGGIPVAAALGATFGLLCAITVGAARH